MPILEREGGLSDRQFEVGKARSTVNAISTVMRIAEIAMNGNKSCPMLAVNVGMLLISRFNHKTKK